MADKEPEYSNAATYEPPQPRSRGKRCCCCFFQGLCIVLGSILCFYIIVCLVLFVVYLIIQPRSFRFHVTEATLTQFNYTQNDNTLHYHLVLNFTVENPNKRLSIYYDHVVAHVSYARVTFSSTDVVTWRNGFRLGTESTERFGGVFAGQNMVAFDESQVKQLQDDEKKGVFSLMVKLRFEIRFRSGRSFNYGDTRPGATCGLHLPLASNGTFATTECDVDHF